MKKPETAPVRSLFSAWPRPFSALRSRWAEGYGWADFRADVAAGAVVGVVAIPLSMALAIASGVAPQYGLYTAIVAGFVTALVGGSRFQVTGPTAAFVVILAPVVEKFGMGGLLVAGLMAGAILFLMGLARMGRLIQFIPHPVTTGFTAGIALVIATLELKDFFGLRPEVSPEHYHQRVAALLRAAGSWSPAETAVGAATLALLVFWPRITRRVPAPLAALGLVTPAVAGLQRWFPGFSVDTIGSRFTAAVGDVVVRGVPRALPALRWPWSFSGPQGAPLAVGWRTIEALLPAAFAIAMLGAIESLLSAVVADGMGRTRHDPDAELLALGTSNLLCPFFGAIPATGAIARTAANIRFGAKSPVAAMAHAVFILLAVLLFAPAISFLPMAALAALLMLVAYNMSELRHFKHILRVGPRSDALVLLLCFGLTVAFDMVIGVSAGIVLAALLFMRRMAQVTTGAALPEDHHARVSAGMPEGAVLYEIAGPLFFGAAESAVSALGRVGAGAKVVVFLMSGVPAMDVTGLVSFESAVEEITRRGQRVVLAGARPQPMALMAKSPVFSDSAAVTFCRTEHEAARAARAMMAG